jgi:hypothetical protein
MPPLLSAGWWSGSNPGLSLDPTGCNCVGECLVVAFVLVGVDLPRERRVLGAIVVIRIVLSFSLDVEIDGMWPWNRWRQEPPTP